VPEPSFFGFERDPHALTGNLEFRKPGLLGIPMGCKLFSASNVSSHREKPLPEKRLNRLLGGFDGI
jgi:hypothetical protein